MTLGFLVLTFCSKPYMNRSERVGLHVHFSGLGNDLSNSRFSVVHAMANNLERLYWIHLCCLCGNPSDVYRKHVQYTAISSHL